MRNTKNARKETREITGEHKGKHSTNTNMITHVLDPRNTKRYTVQIQQRMIQVAVVHLREKVLNPRGIFP
mgnify:CR=1 FL=1